MHKEKKIPFLREKSLNYSNNLVMHYYTQHGWRITNVSGV